MEAKRERRSAGYTLTEMVVTIAIIGVVASMGVPQAQKWAEDQEASAMARDLANTLYVARVEAIRSGSNQAVFLGIGSAGDTAGNPLMGDDGEPAAMLVVDDGMPGSTDQNCEIDAGEDIFSVGFQDTVQWGAALSGATRAPGDFTGVAPTATGSTFTTPAGTAATWVMFRPDGTPLAMDSGCNAGSIGSGNGAVYLNNGTRQYAVVLHPLGGVKVHRWDGEAGVWNE